MEGLACLQAFSEVVVGEVFSTEMQELQEEVEVLPAAAALEVRRMLRVVLSA